MRATESSAYQGSAEDLSEISGPATTAGECSARRAPAYRIAASASKITPSPAVNGGVWGNAMPKRLRATCGDQRLRRAEYINVLRWGVARCCYGSAPIERSIVSSGLSQRRALRETRRRLCRDTPGSHGARGK